MEQVNIDTDILADFLRNKDYAIEWIRKNKDKILAITVISLYELYYGAYRSNNPERSLNSVIKLKEKLLILNLDDDSVLRAGEIYYKLEKDGKIIDLKDIFIGAISLSHGFSLKTNNIKHFERINGLKLAE